MLVRCIPMTPNYLLHDNVYRRHKDQGLLGWSSAEHFERFYEELVTWMQGFAEKPIRVLVLGCGAGDACIELVKHGMRVSGIDISPTAINWAQEKAGANPNVDFCLGSVLDLPYPAEHFDWVLDGFCWHCIIGPDRGSFLSEAKRVLAPGGIFTGIAHTSCRLVGDPNYREETRTYFMGDTPIRYFAPVDELLGDLQAAGLHVMRSDLRAGVDGERDDLLWVDALR
jgi:ubiquinone/menaquinone biosynthesis C-methylase UbiE